MKRARSLTFSPTRVGVRDDTPEELTVVDLPLRVHVENEHAPECHVLRDDRPTMADGRAVWYIDQSSEMLPRRDKTGGTRSRQHLYMRFVCAATNCQGSLLVRLEDLSRMFEIVRTRRRHRGEE